MQEITHAEQCAAADYAGLLDYEAEVRNCGGVFAEMRKLHLSNGAFRAFEWLEQNGFKVIKEDSK